MAKANGELKIEKGIPFPPRNSLGTGVASVMREMKVGDSVLLKLARTTVSNAAKFVMGTGNYATRREGDGFRVWRTK